MATTATKQSGKDEDSQEFRRKTTKYWVHPVDIPEVKRILGKNLPEYRFSTKISKMIQSLYFDSDELKMYYDRVMLLDKGKIFRYRWYGDGVPPLGFMEQKIRRLGWLNEEKSVKRRIKISNQLADAYVKGQFIPTEKNSTPALTGESLALALELQKDIVEGGLKPVIRTAYVRSCYQTDFHAPLRVSFDEELQFSLCVNNEFLIMDAAELQKRLLPHQKYNFPHAILEIKVRLSGEGRNQLPPWCQDLIDRKLITAMDKYSKFNTAVGVFFHDKIDRIPWYFSMVETHPPAPKLDFLADLELELADQPDLRDETIHKRVADWKKDKRGGPDFHMQVERTYLKWLRTCISLSAVGSALLAFDNFVGLSLIIGGFLVGIRSVYLYHYRSYVVRRGRTGKFYDPYNAPLALVMWVICVFLLTWTGVKHYKNANP